MNYHDWASRSASYPLIEWEPCEGIEVEERALTGDEIAQFRALLEGIYESL